MLNYPYHYQKEFIEESGFDISTVPQLNSFNQKVVNIYNLIYSSFNVSLEFALSIEFKEISKSKVYYICNVLTKINELVIKHKEYEAAKEQHKAEVKRLVEYKKSSV